MKRRVWLAAGAGALVARPSWSEPAATGDVVDWPRLRLLDGSVWEPASWQGQPALVVLWATYCPFCKRHNAHVDRLSAQPGLQGLRVLGIALDADERLVRQYLAGNAYRFPVVLDAGRLRSRLTARRVIPMTLAIDRQGRLQQAIAGEMFEQDLLDLAGSLLKRAA